MRVWVSLVLLLSLSSARGQSSDPACSESLSVGTALSAEDVEQLAAWERMSALVFHLETYERTSKQHLEAARKFWEEPRESRMSVELQPKYALRFDLDTRRFLVRGPGNYVLLFSRVPEGSYRHPKLVQFFNKLRTGLRFGVAKRALQFRNQEELEDHFRRHGPLLREHFVVRFEEGFGSQAYLTLAREFALSTSPLSFSFEAENGEFTKINPVTHEFLVLNRDGIVRTYHLFSPKEGSLRAVHRAFRKLFEATIPDSASAPAVR